MYASVVYSVLLNHMFWLEFQDSGMVHENIKYNIYFSQFYLKFKDFLLKNLVLSIYNVHVWLLTGFITLKKKTMKTYIHLSLF